MRNIHEIESQDFAQRLHDADADAWAILKQAYSAKMQPYMANQLLNFDAIEDADLVREIPQLIDKVWFAAHRTIHQFQFYRYGDIFRWLCQLSESIVIVNKLPKEHHAFFDLLKQQNQFAWTAVISEYRQELEPYAYSLIRHLGYSQQDAADVAEDALIVAYEQIERLREPERLVGWLYLITKYRAYNFTRKDMNRQRLMSDKIAPSVTQVTTHTPENLLIDDEELGIFYDVLTDILLSLSTELERRVFLHRFMYGEKPSTIAAAEGIEANDVYTITRRTKEQAKRLLQERGIQLHSKRTTDDHPHAPTADSSASPVERIDEETS